MASQPVGSVAVRCLRDDDDGALTIEVACETIRGDWLPQIAATVLAHPIIDFPEEADVVLLMMLDSFLNAYKVVNPGRRGPKFLFHSDGARSVLLTRQYYDQFMGSMAGGEMKDEFEFYRHCKDANIEYAVEEEET